MAAGTVILDVGTVAVGVTVGVASRGAHGLDGGIGLFADPFQEHGLDGREVPDRLRVVAFGDALSVAAVEQVVTHDPAAAFAVGGFGGVAVRVNPRGPGGAEPGGVVGVLGESGAPCVVSEGGVPCRAQIVNFVHGGGAGGTGAGR